MEGTGAVVNAVGLYTERGGETFDGVQVQGAWDEILCFT